MVRNFIVCSCSGRELFLADASLFVDDAEAFDFYEREEEPEAAGPSEQVRMSLYSLLINPPLPSIESLHLFF